MLCSNGLIQSVLQSELSNHMIRDSEFQMCSLLLSWHVLVARLEISNRLLRWWWVWGQETLNILTRPTQRLRDTSYLRHNIRENMYIHVFQCLYTTWYKIGLGKVQNIHKTSKIFPKKKLFLIDLNLPLHLMFLDKVYLIEKSIWFNAWEIAQQM